LSLASSSSPLLSWSLRAGDPGPEDGVGGNKYDLIETAGLGDDNGTSCFFETTALFFCLALLNKSVYDAQEVGSGKHEKIQNI